MTRGSKPKPLPEHGTYARFVGRPHAGIAGCRCAPCAETGRKYCARRYALNGTGRKLTVDSTSAAKHLQGLFDGGAGWALLVSATGCSSSVLQGVLSGRKIHARTERKIMAVRLAQVVNGERLVPSLGAIRRVRALLALGHEARVIAATAGVSKTTVSDLIGGSITEVRARIHDAIQKSFEQLAMTTGSSIRSINRARQEQWAPPLAWDDIDDPNETPQYGEQTASLGLAIVENTAELARLGYSRPAIAERLGTTWDAICQAHRRTGTQLPRILTAA